MAYCTGLLFSCIIMHATPFGRNANTYYADFYRARSQQECRLADAIPKAGAGCRMSAGLPGAEHSTG